MNIKHKISKFISIPALLIMFVGFGFATPGWALDLQSAKSQGLVGEQPNGYLGAVKSPNNEVKKLIADINTKRKDLYQSIAKRNKTSLDVVEKMAGKKAMEKTPSGQYVMQPSGKWQKK